MNCGASARACLLFYIFFFLSFIWLRPLFHNTAGTCVGTSRNRKEILLSPCSKKKTIKHVWVFFIYLRVDVSMLDICFILPFKCYVLKYIQTFKGSSGHGPEDPISTKMWRKGFEKCNARLWTDEICIFQKFCVKDNHCRCVDRENIDHGNRHNLISFYWWKMDQKEDVRESRADAAMTNLEQGRATT